MPSPGFLVARPAERASRYVKQASYAVPTTRLNQKWSAIASLFRESLEKSFLSTIIQNHKASLLVSWLGDSNNFIDINSSPYRHF